MIKRSLFCFCTAKLHTFFNPTIDKRDKILLQIVKTLLRHTVRVYTKQQYIIIHIGNRDCISTCYMVSSNKTNGIARYRTMPFVYLQKYVETYYLRNFLPSMM